MLKRKRTATNDSRPHWKRLYDLSQAELDMLQGYIRNLEKKVSDLEQTLEATETIRHHQVSQFHYRIHELQRPALGKNVSCFEP